MLPPLLLPIINLMIMTKSGGGARRYILPIFKKNWGARAPPVPYTPPAHDNRKYYIVISKNEVAFNLHISIVF